MKNKLELNPDGSMVGTTFTKRDTGKNMEYPRPNSGESYRQYRKRVDALVKEGFHLGDLGFSDWSNYCTGGGQTGEDVDIDLPIGYVEPWRQERREREQKERERQERQERGQQDW